jgi:C_GCAxxG_C_C family probable redox protein
MPEGCEKMSKQGDAAYAWFLKGYNCSQSVVAAFAPQLGLTEEMALRLSAGFGAGIGRMREVCGAFCGVVTVLSMVYADPADPKDKSRMYALVQQTAEQYRTRNGGGSIICRELLAKAGVAPAGGTAAEDRTADYYKKRPCPELCRLCADLCTEFIAAHPEGRHGFYKEEV